ncbi:glycosyl hydrolase [Aspergillus karnatakaensis]|uniref:glycosyl hydrolase n=1 Tax=Aspergillus karnatakaensis TaxID=1810916 RepID=UPI003CCCA0F5
MRIKINITSLLLLFASFSTAQDQKNGARNSTFTNPMLPGWHSDPSCTFVPELDNTTFCTVSTFLNFPGLSIYATKDLVHFRHVSNAFSRPEQIPGHASMNNNNRGGIWAPTIRYREGKMYVIFTYTSYDPKERVNNLLVATDDPYNDESWGTPLKITNPTGGNHIDPDLFWDNDGTAYMATGWGKIFLSTIDTTTGVASERVEIWKGTGGSNAEGPHIYRKDGYYYLLVAEGGFAENHAATIARARDIWGPYENGNGNWWATALATRSGRERVNYPMGREAILTPVTWNGGEWPVFDQVFGVMEGPLPSKDSNPPGDGPLVHEGDSFDFHRGFTFPKHLVHFRTKNPDAYKIAPGFLHSSLRLIPSALNLTGGEAIEASVDNSLTFLGRRQTATLFDFSVDLSFNPNVAGEEAGVTVFLNQQQHIELSVVRTGESKEGRTHLQLAGTSFGRLSAPAVETVVRDIPKLWRLCPSIRLSIRAEDPDGYTFVASSSCGIGDIRMGSVSSDIVSGGFLGSLVGIYATNNNGTGETPSYWSRWRYRPVSQEIDEGEFAPVAL